jgi:hypothetical protein
MKKIATATLIASILEKILIKSCSGNEQIRFSKFTHNGQSILKSLCHICRTACKRRWKYYSSPHDITVVLSNRIFNSKLVICTYFFLMNQSRRWSCIHINTPLLKKTTCIVHHPELHSGDWSSISARTQVPVLIESGARAYPTLATNVGEENIPLSLPV